MTSKEWKTYKLSDFMEFNPRETLAKGTIAKKIAMENLQPFCRDVCQYEFAPYNGGVKFKNGDTIMARITPCLENGKTSKVNILEDNEIAFGSTEYIVFRKRDNISDENFIYYLVTSPKIREIAIKSMVGSSGRQRVQADVLADLELELPPLETQEKIARALSSLDDKIELNNKINQNLEQQAQAIFKSWFIDIQDSKNYSEKFGNLPKDAIVSSISDIDMLITDYVANGSFASLKENVKLYQEPNYAYFIRNTDLKSNTFNVYVDRHSYDFLSKSVLYGNEIIISNVGDVGSVFLCPKLDKPMTLGNNIIMLRPNKVEMLYYLYIWFKWSYGQDLIQGIKGGSAQPKFNKTDFKSLQIIIPSEGMLNNFNKIVAPMFQNIENNSKEKVFLAQLRDTLLPKLMSGEIDVDKII